MSTLLDGEVDFDTTSLEEWDIACDVARLVEQAIFEWAGPWCPGDPARWIGRRGCCGAVTLLCDSCKDEYLDRTAKGALHTCVLCGNHHSGYTSFEPLRAA